MTVKADVVLSPEEILPEADSWLVIDILRATTTMCACFDGGGEILHPCPSVEDAFLLRDRLAAGGRNPLLMGERNALPPEGFDLGNSPLELLEFGPSKRPEAVMATTNGTRALLKAAASGKPVRPVCARNASAVLDASLKDGGSVGILCAGLHGRAALDDTACAGLLVELLLRRGDAELQDGAVMALDVWRSGGRDMAAILRRSVHGRRILALGFEKDLACAGETDVSRSVAQLEEAETGGPVLRTR